jgi:DNA-binding NarL/FixJ family response regulator
MITVLLVADDPAVRSAHRDDLATTGDLVVVGEAVGTREIKRGLTMLEPDVVLVDVSTSTSTFDAARTTRLVLQTRPAAIVIVVAGSEHPEHAIGALAAGAHGYVTGRGTREVARALRSAVASNRPPGSPPAVAQGASGIAFTPRQQEVLRLVAGGLSNDQISARLGISEQTVKAHLRGAVWRLRSTGRAGAAARALGGPRDRSQGGSSSTV